MALDKERLKIILNNSIFFDEKIKKLISKSATSFPMSTNQLYSKTIDSRLWDFSGRYKSVENWMPVTESVFTLLQSGFYLSSEDFLLTCFYCGLKICHNDTIEPNCVHLYHLQQSNYECEYAIAIIKYMAELMSNELDKNTDKNINQNFDKSSYQQLFYDVDESNLPKCGICLDQSRTILFLPCHHVIACKSCADKITLCVICRQKILSRIKFFFA